ncbi:MAG: hypothetical protein N2321_01890 [Melioribacteraceae bacterium]|nr:hypothetical protein [Melioribacteraceae bacterium]
MYSNEEKENKISERTSSGSMNLIGAILFGMFFVFLIAGQFGIAIMSMIVSLVLLIRGSIISNKTQSKDWTNLVIDKEDDNNKCPKCNYWNQGAVKYCSNCGTKLLMICNNCSVENPRDAKYCNSCGNKLY